MSTGATCDALGTVHGRAGGDARIVSLVPSITELVCDLGLSDQLVGRTGFCIHPWDTVRTIPKVGGTKDVKLDRVRELEPTHAIVNVDENLRETAEQLAEFVPHVIVTHPQAPADNLALYRLLGDIFDREAEAERLCAEFSAALSELQVAEHVPLDVLYLIWRDPWMAVAPDTYIAQTLGAGQLAQPPTRCVGALPRGRPRRLLRQGRSRAAEQRALPFQGAPHPRGGGARRRRPCEPDRRRDDLLVWKPRDRGHPLPRPPARVVQRYVMAWPDCSR